MQLNAIFHIVISLFAVQGIIGITSPIQPYINYTYSIELQNNVADLWWTVNEAKQDIVFELHVNTTGWIALGISPGMYLLTTESFRICFYFFISWWNDRC